MSGPPRIALSQLLQGVAAVTRDTVLTDLALDSHQVTPGGAFLACRGARHHGLDFAADVARRGAAAIVWETDGTRRPPSMDSDIVLAEVPRLAEHASFLADRFFASPSRHLDVVGVTGTNGKTTCAWLLAQAWNSCDEPAAYIGTLGSAFGDAVQAGELTTPDAITVQRELARFGALGARKVAMEVSSHGLVLGRVQAVHFDAAVFTNLTRDHLDFHGDMDAYGSAKASLFEREDVRLRVFNVDDPFGARLAARPAFAGRIACSSRGAAHGRGTFLDARNIQYTGEGTSFGLSSSFGDATVRTPLLGEFNVDNVLAVLAVLLGSGIPMQRAIPAVGNVQAPPGRLEVVAVPGKPLAVIDYAHTPDALEQALRVLRRHCAGQLTVVFGCGGDRDRGKRPLMGAAAARGADRIVLTNDNPRTEEPLQILADIRAGTGAAATAVVPDRRAAIIHALKQATSGDLVLVAGKGHETTQSVGGQVHPFSDRQVVREVLGLA